MSRWLALWFCLAVILVPIAARADLEAGVAAFQRGDYVMALKEFTPLERQNRVAQVGLGVMYLEGLGVARDSARAFSLLSSAAEAGEAQAFFPLASLYGLGLGTQKDDERSAFWLRKAT
jgi:TPR repeat protein